MKQGGTYYNEIEPFAAQWLRNLIDAGLIPAGEVDGRSIVDVAPEDLGGFSQAHFFAGVGGWSLAARLAGWPDDRPLWTGSGPCQPFSVAGKQKGHADARHLWPEFFRLIRARRPDVVMGEQVAAAVGKDWLDGVLADLESIDYACGAVVVPACAVDAPHRRDRVWFVGDAVGARLEGQPRYGDGATRRAQQDRPTTPASFSDDARIVGHDGKARRFKPGVRLLAHGVPARVGRLRAYGNAIVPQVAAEVIAAWMECAP